MDDEQVAAYLAKAARSLAGAESEFKSGRYDNCVNRAYYACFQAAVATLLRAGIKPRGQGGRWGHEYVPAQFADQLINRRKLYPGDLRRVLPDIRSLREAADYKPEPVSQTQATRALRRSREFVQAVQSQGGKSS